MNSGKVMDQPRWQGHVQQRSDDCLSRRISQFVFKGQQAAGEFKIARMQVSWKDLEKAKGNASGNLNKNDE